MIQLILLTADKSCLIYGNFASKDVHLLEHVSLKVDSLFCVKIILVLYARTIKHKKDPIT